MYNMYKLNNGDVVVPSSVADVAPVAGGSEPPRNPRSEEVREHTGRGGLRLFFATGATLGQPDCDSDERPESAADIAARLRSELACQQAAASDANELARLRTTAFNK